MVSQLSCPGIRPPSGTCDQFFFLFRGNYLQTVALFLLWVVLSDEDGPIICDSSWVPPTQSLLGLNPTEL
jgi:hypothetical protein